MSLTRNAVIVNRRAMACLNPFPKSIRCFTAHASRYLESSKLESQPRPSPVAKEVRPAYLTPLQEMLSLRGKVTVVTGAARGIGLALATVSAELGSDVAVIDTLEELHPDFDRLNEFGVKIRYYRSDVTQPKALTETFDNIAVDFGHIDNCVTAAGIVLDKPYLDHDWEESMRILNVNVIGTFFSAQLASKHMASQKTGGSIVMIASVASHCAIPSQRLAMYGASKGAVRVLAKHLAVEMAPYNIRVNTISPGYIATDMTKALGLKDPDMLSIFESAAPMKRMGDRKDLKGIVGYLLTDAAAYTTGADIEVTGGLHAGRI